MNLDEASKKVFEDQLNGFERETATVFTAAEDREALANMISDWRRLGPKTLQKLSMNQPWNMPTYFALAAAVLNRREINELRRAFFKTASKEKRALIKLHHTNLPLTFK